MPVLELSDVHAGYDGVEVLHGVDLAVEKGEIVALIGSNGAGKTTTTRVIGGLLEPTAGSVRYRDEEIGGAPPHEIVRRGIVQVPEDRELFGNMTVRENLLLGAQTDRAKEKREQNIDRVLDLFPRLEERKSQLANTMSGGEQQMLTLARALLGEPDLLVLDEPSIGLAPQLVEEMFDVIEEVHDEGLTTLIIEQNVRQTLELADRAYVMESGDVTISGDSADLLDDERVVEAYLGV